MSRQMKGQDRNTLRKQEEGASRIGFLNVIGRAKVEKRAGVRFIFEKRKLDLLGLT